MLCDICGSTTLGAYCKCGAKMKIPEFINSTIEIKNNDVKWEGEPAYMRHLEIQVKLAHKDWITKSLKTSVNLPKKEKSKFWMENIKSALNGGLPC